MPKWAPFVRVLAAGLLVVAAAASPSRSEEEPASDRWFQRRMAAVGKSAAARLWVAVERARDAQLFAYARDEASRVLELDPDHRSARLFLGFARRPEGWILETDAHARVPKDNRPPATGTLAEVEIAWRSGPATKADLDAAALYAAFATECDAQGYDAYADFASRRAFAFDPRNVAAHKAVHHQRLSDAVWLPEKAQREFAAAKAVVQVAEPSRWEETLDAKLAKAESGHFRVESPHPPAAVEGYLAACERAYAAYLSDLGLAPDERVFAQKPVFCVLAAAAQWERWINRVAPSAEQGTFRPLTWHWARDRWACALRSEGATDESRRDRLAHETVHMMNLALWSMADGHWLDEALANRYPVLLDGTTTSACVSRRETGDAAAVSAQRDWSRGATWRASLADAVRAGEDVPLRIVVSKSSREQPMAAAVKAWSVVEFLLRRDRKAFVSVLKEMKTAKDPVVSLETAYGKDVDTLDAEWRRWVLETAN